MPTYTSLRLGGKMVKLKPKEIGLFKLVTWSCLLVWMLMFFIFSLSIAGRASTLGPIFFGATVTGHLMAWILPILVVFTCLLIIIGVARFANRRLKGDKVR